MKEELERRQKEVPVGLQMSAENQGARPQTQASRLEKERQRQRRIAVEAGGFCRKPFRD